MNTTPVSPRIRWLNLLGEIRVMSEVLSGLRSRSRLLAECPPGDGHPVLVIPGFLASDHSTWALRRFLRDIGYAAFGWGQGLNTGPSPGLRMRLLEVVAGLRRRFGERISLIGWSLGGVYARDIALYRPRDVRTVITLGTPLHGPVQGSAIWRLFALLNRKWLAGLSADALELRLKPLCVPSMTVYSPSDGIVCGPACAVPRGLAGTSVAVDGSHIGLVHNPRVLRAVAEHLPTTASAYRDAA